jgi:His/Glu/Gln/Arg/opine family amino acid ABC transporter permease subunit
VETERRSLAMDIFGGSTSEILGPLLLLLLRRGLPTTLQLSALAFCASVIIGFLLGLLRFHKVPIVRWPVSLYVDTMRGLPFIMILFIVYHIIPLLVEFKITEMTAALCALVMHEGAYFTEIIRASLDSIPKHQAEASKALGFNYFQRMRYVILPQAVRLTLPPAASETVLLIKNTAVVSVIGLMELTRIGRVQMQTNLQPFLTFAIVGVIYFMVCYPMLRLSTWLEEKIAKGIRQST